MKRKDILDQLKKFKIVQFSDINIEELTDKQLELRLNLFKSMANEGDRALKD